MAVSLFYDPQRVAQLRAKGITASRPEPAVTPATTDDQAGAQTALELVDENARLRAEIDRLRRENRQLTEDVENLSAELTRRQLSAERSDPSRRSAIPTPIAAAPVSVPALRASADGGDDAAGDDATKRFALLELD